MLYDQFGRPIPEQRLRPPVPGLQIVSDPVSDREAFNVSRRNTPRDVDRIMTLANSGDIEDQCRLSRELPELDGEIKEGLATRRNALSGCKWQISPGDKSEPARIAAERLKNDFDAAGGNFGGDIGRLYSFPQLLRGLTDALLPGFAAAEIAWKPGGAGFYGFRIIEQRFFSFAHGYTPRLRIRENYDGIELPYGKVIFHQLDENGPDPVRGGLIRPLAWLHCFKSINEKDLLSFIERFGMPFVLVQIDDATRKSEGPKLEQLIRNLGPSGGGILSKNAEIKLLEMSSNSGDVYFKLLEYLDRSTTKVLLGQTATSGDAQGLSKGDAQSRVRQDILEADARALENTINVDLIEPWMRYNCPEGVRAPLLHIISEPPEDTVALAAMVKTFYEGGLQVADPAEISKKVGITFERRPEPVAQPAPGGMASLQLAEMPTDQPAPAGALEKWLGPVEKVLAELSECSDPEQFAAKLGELSSGRTFGSSAGFEKAVEQTVYEGLVRGMDAAARSRKGGTGK